MEVFGLTSTSPANIVLRHLRRHGQATIKELEGVLGVSTTAVREHLAHLQSHALVTSNAVRYGPGRPRLVYTLTDKAQRLFPKNYDLLINLLLQEIASEEGAEKVEHLLQRISTRLAEDYTDRMKSDDIQERLAELRARLEDQGIVSEVQPTGNGISIFSCPYLAVAHEHTEVCSMERRMVEHVLGKKVVQEHSILEGDHHCCFIVGEKIEKDVYEQRSGY
jgi:DeoR family transcriptional regulator, suf operon transcriptional repressor